MHYIKIITYSIIIVVLLSCQSKLLTVHKIDVQQGNALDTEMVNKIKVGMTQDQVQYVLGSPLITDSFHPDRWDYIYLFTPGYGDPERRQLTLIFDRGEVIEIDKHNIAEQNISSNISKDKDKNKNEEKQLSEKDQKDLESLEKQADTLEEVLHENKSPK